MSEFDGFLFLGKKYLEYFIYVQKARNINWVAEYSEDDIRMHTIALLHFLNDMGTNAEQEPLNSAELLTENGLIKDMLTEAEKLDTKTEKPQADEIII